MNKNYIKYCPNCGTRSLIHHEKPTTYKIGSVSKSTISIYCVKCGKIEYKDLYAKTELKRKQREQKLKRILNDNN